MSEYHCRHSPNLFNQFRGENPTDPTDNITKEEQNPNRRQNNIKPLIKIIRKERLSNKSASKSIKGKQNTKHKNRWKVLMLNACKVEYNNLFRYFGLYSPRVVNRGIC